ncbi:Amino-acid acetyltransferase, mitochondrial, partial [Cladochytrium tenue]
MVVLQDLVLRILSAMPSQREARFYLDRYWKDSSGGKPTSQSFESAIAPSYDMRDHLALVRLDAQLPTHALRSFAATLVQLQRLGLAPVLLLNFPRPFLGELPHSSAWIPTASHRFRRLSLSPSSRSDRAAQRFRDSVVVECNRVASAIDDAGGRSVAFYSDVFAVDHAASRMPVTEPSDDAAPANSAANAPPLADVRVTVDNAAPISSAIQARKAIIVPPLGTEVATSKTAALPSGACLLALAQTLSHSDRFAGLPSKLFLVNQAGGIVAGRARESVGFVNLNDEYDALRNSLLRGEARLDDAVERHHAAAAAVGRPRVAVPVTANLAFQGRFRRKFLPRAIEELSGRDADERVAAANDIATVMAVLSALPPSSSAIVAAADRSSDLVANLLTDKAPSSQAKLVEDALDPAGAIVQSDPDPDAVLPEEEQPSTSAPPTIFRLGLKLQVHHSLDTLDIGRLEGLLEASFRKRLDRDAFWSRMRGESGHYNGVRCRLHSVIIAGDFDGAAIVTLEQPDVDGGGGVYYLDKFSVAPSSQGIGVAEILWRRLRQEYPRLLWRSRAANPVNKWYFERSVGNVRLPGDYWVMFWYGEGGIDRIASYQRVC